MTDQQPGTPAGEFDHTQHRDEVEQRWGKDAYAKSDNWWRGMSAEGRAEWMGRSQTLAQDWTVAALDEAVAPDSPQAQQLAARHIEWLRGMPGTPAADPGGNLDGYVRGLAEMYVADDRFAANYGGAQGAQFVRDALLIYLDERG